MKLLTLIIFSTLQLLANANLSFKTFESDFRQNITNHNGKTISYEGHLIATDKNYFLWRYETPIIKEVYVLDLDVIINEPELEQTIYTKLDKQLNLNTILKEAQKLNSSLYVSRINGVKYTLNYIDNLLQSIAYEDDVQNSVTIYFSNQKKDHFIDTKTFLFEQDPHYDIIKR